MHQAHTVDDREEEITSGVSEIHFSSWEELFTFYQEGDQSSTRNFEEAFRKLLREAKFDEDKRKRMIQEMNKTKNVPEWMKPFYKTALESLRAKKKEIVDPFDALKDRYREKIEQIVPNLSNDFWERWFEDVNINKLNTAYGEIQRAKKTIGDLLDENFAAGIPDFVRLAFLARLLEVNDFYHAAYGAKEKKAQIEEEIRRIAQKYQSTAPSPESP